MFDTNAAFHVRNIRALFEWLSLYDLEISLSQATFGTLDAEFLLHTISPAGVQPMPKKPKRLTVCPCRPTSNSCPASWAG